MAPMRVGLFQDVFHVSPVATLSGLFCGLSCVLLFGQPDVALRTIVFCKRCHTKRIFGHQLRPKREMSLRMGSKKSGPLTIAPGPG
jgi:hypothetical protein